ncbi:transcription initiation factor TFIID subunit 2 isoform X1 [Silene latifolia]|uniref:transcription initiation factor TFIID subunit 2 isoform X1 n=2 Tax=Silene latifolia TaxID=37657 RepID=UPI003D774394
MAKAKKTPKSEGSKPDTSSSEAIVLHQKLCLSIDIDNRRIYGYTELEIAVPDNGIIGLHAENLEIERVYVDGEPADFDVFPHYQPVDIENRWCSVSSVDSAADAAGVTYISALERELVPNLLILCRNLMAAGNQQQGPAPQENGGQSNGEVKQNVKLIRIDYWVEKAEAGVHFDDKVLHTHSQIRRAHCWFPCMDDSLQRCCFDLEFTVPHNFVAVSNGTLLYQVLSKDDPPRKTFVYKLNIPVSARWISLAVAPFQILPDYQNCLLSHMCLAGSLPKLQNTMEFFHSAFRHYETYLESPFPFGSYKQVFIAPEMVISSVTLGASMGIFSSHILFDEKVIDQTIVTRIKLLYALARQWFGVFITPETPNDEWLVEGLAGFLTDTFVKEFLGNNEARYRRYKANCAVCKADESGATTLSPSSSPKVFYGTQSIGLYGRIRSWKSVAILQMLEKQMGPDLFRGILRAIVSRAQDNAQSLRTLSTKEFRHYANKLGNLERPFLKEFFNRWVEACGCPVLRMGFSYNKRKNMVELAAFRECTAVPKVALGFNNNLDSENHGENGWPGMMTVKVHELDGTHDHLLPMAGDACQLLEIKCHSRLATKRFQKPKKSSKPDGSDDNGDPVVAVDVRSGTESPLLWVRADPEMEYLAEIHLSQPLHMWINQLEKDRDVVAQAEAIITLEEFPNIPFPIINSLSNFVADSKAFWRVRIEAAFALAKIASEDSDWAGMLNLIKYYKSKRFDPSIGLPKPNNFHDLAEYFVLEAIPHAVATVRTVDNKSPKEAVEFVLQVLKYNDNSGNPYSDVFWLAALVEAVGELEFGQQGISFLSSFLKRIDRLLQFDRLMPSYNGILTVRCIRTLTQIALKLSEFITVDRLLELIKPFQDASLLWQVRIEASRALLDIEYHCNGIDAALLLFMKYLEEEPTLRGQAKLGIHMIRLSQITAVSRSNDDVKSQTLVTLLRLLESRIAFHNVFLRHHLFCILQVLAGRRPTLYDIPRDQIRQTGYADICSQQRNNFLAFINQMKPMDPSAEYHSPFDQEPFKMTDPMGEFREPNMQVEEPLKYVDTITNSQSPKIPVQNDVNAFGQVQDVVAHEAPKDVDVDVEIDVDVDVDTISPSQNHKILVLADAIAKSQELNMQAPEATQDVDTHSSSQIHNMPAQPDAIANNNEHNMQVPEASKDVTPISDCQILPAQTDVIATCQGQNVPGQEATRDEDTISTTRMEKMPVQVTINHVDAVSNNQVDKLPVQETLKEADSISTSRERRVPVVKIRVKPIATSNNVERASNSNLERSQVGYKQVNPAASSSVSVDAPDRNFTEAVCISNHVTEEVNSCQGRGSHMTASIGSAKVARGGDDVGRDLQCTADSSTIHPTGDHSSLNFGREEGIANLEVQKPDLLHAASVVGEDVDRGSLSTANPEMGGKRKDKKDKKRKRDDPEYLERKRLKKEKKQKKKEMAKSFNVERQAVPGEAPVRLTDDGKKRTDDEVKLSRPLGKREESSRTIDDVRLRPPDRGMPLDSTLRMDGLRNKETGVGLMPNNDNGPRLVLKRAENKPKATEGGSGTKLRIKIKNRTLDRS